MIKIKAIQVLHGAKNKSHEIFVGAIKIKDLIDSTKIKVDYWRDADRNNVAKQGYQRNEKRSQVSKIKKMIFSEGVNFPTTLLLSYRKLSNRLPLYTYNKDKSELSLNEFPIFLVDGQHRAAGIRDAINESTKTDPTLVDKEVGIVIMIGLDKFEEMQYFETINTTPKKVETSLAIELLTLRAKEFPEAMEGLKRTNQTWIVKGNGIIHKLNQQSGSPWYKVVKMPNEKYDKTSNAVAGSGQLLQSLKVLMNSSLEVYRLDKSAEIINNYWEILREFFPDAFLRPKGYVIQKTPGMFSLHMLLDYILKKLGSEGKLPTKENFKLNLKQVFENIGIEGFGDKNKNSHFWQSGNKDGASMYRGQAGFKSLYTKFVEEGLDGFVG